MSIIYKLSSALGHRDEVPNQELAKAIAAGNDSAAVKELVANLGNKDKKIQSDCIKVLYEIGEANPQLVSPYAKEFAELLNSKNNRLQWGAMTALDTIALEKADVIFPELGKIISVADAGSVITTDHCVSILIKLCSVKQYAADCFHLLAEQLQKCPTNQLPMYAENAIPIINDANRATFIKILSARLDEIEKDTKRKRVKKVIKKVSV